MDKPTRSDEPDPQPMAGRSGAPTEPETGLPDFDIPDDWGEEGDEPTPTPDPTPTPEPPSGGSTPETTGTTEP